MTAIVFVVLGALLAFANGSNDVSKGIATLVGSGVTQTKRAILWGTLWTGAGALLSLVVASAMFKTFGTGILASDVHPNAAAGLASLCGAAAWVLIATRFGFPVSTTHAIVGSLVGVAAVAYGVGGVQWPAIASKIAIPLLATPLLSGVVVVSLLAASRRVFAKPACVCVAAEPPLSVGAGSSASALPRLAHLRVVMDSETLCQKHGLTTVASETGVLSRLHWLTAGATSFARGLNDAPKIVALVAGATALSAGAALSTPLLFGVIATAMVVGSLYGGRITHVLAEKVTAMDHREGFAANLVAALLVTAGAVWGLPMSTTHVASGGIIGAGTLRGGLNKQTLRTILLAWVVTLPAAATLGVVALWMFQWLS